MCKLIPMTFPTGVTANVADIKVEKLKKYLEIFPQLKSFDKVYLFGSTLEQKCREESDIDFLVFYNDKKQYRYDKIEILPELLDTYIYDDWIPIKSNDPDFFPIGATRKAIKEGVLIYERH